MGLNMKKKISMVMFSIVLVLVLAVFAEASIVNGSFEDGLNNWTSSTGSAHFSTMASYTLYDGSILNPDDGSSFAVVTGDNFLPPPTMSQTISFKAGDVLSGVAALEINALGNPPVPGVPNRHDYLKITIDSLEVLKIENIDSWVEDPVGAWRGYQSWTPWQWTVPADGDYILYLFESTEKPSNDSTNGWYVHAFFDDIRVSSVPIPGALWLLGSGLIGIVGIRRKFKN